MDPTDYQSDIDLNVSVAIKDKESCIKKNTKPPDKTSVLNNLFDSHSFIHVVHMLRSKEEKSV